MLWSQFSAILTIFFSKKYAIFLKDNVMMPKFSAKVPVLSQNGQFFVDNI
jgi:hypothetical protein